jgi:hypothetical protein
MTEDTETESRTLLDKTVQLLQASQESYFKIYDNTGLHPNWLSSIATGKNRDPSVNRIEKLYQYLTGTKLTP